MIKKHEFLKLGECATVRYDVLQKIVAPGEQTSWQFIDLWGIGLTKIAQWKI